MASATSLATARRPPHLYTAGLASTTGSRPNTGFSSTTSIDDRIVIEIGATGVRAGAAGETAPRTATAPVQPDAAGLQLLALLNSGQQDVPRANALLHIILRNIFYRVLLVDPKLRRIIICENQWTPLWIKHVLANLLFKKFNVPSIAFIPSQFSAIIATGKPSGLIIDCGCTETRVLPIYDGTPLFAYSCSTPLAGQAVSARLKQLIEEHGQLMLGDGTFRSILPAEANELWETISTDDLKARIIVAQKSANASNASNASSSVHDQHASLEVRTRQGHLIRLPAWIRHAAANVLFETDDEGDSLPLCVLRSLHKCPVSIRMEIIGNMLACGGTFMIPGMEMRLAQELVEIAEKLPSYAWARGLATKSKFMHSPFSPSLHAWIGGSLIGHVKIKVNSEVTKEEYSKHGFVPDWSIDLPNSHTTLYQTPL